MSILCLANSENVSTPLPQLCSLTPNSTHDLFRKYCKATFILRYHIHSCSAFSTRYLAKSQSLSIQQRRTTLLWTSLKLMETASTT